MKCYQNLFVKIEFNFDYCKLSLILVLKRVAEITLSESPAFVNHIEEQLVQWSF